MSSKCPKQILFRILGDLKVENTVSILKKFFFIIIIIIDLTLREKRRDLDADNSPLLNMFSPAQRNFIWVDLSHNVIIFGGDVVGSRR